MAALAEIAESVSSKVRLLGIDRDNINGRLLQQQIQFATASLSHASFDDNGGLDQRRG